MLNQRHLTTYAAIGVTFLGGLAIGRAVRHDEAVAAPATAAMRVIAVDTINLEVGRSYTRTALPPLAREPRPARRQAPPQREVTSAPIAPRRTPPATPRSAPPPPRRSFKVPRRVFRKPAPVPEPPVTLGAGGEE